jgi:hypothetical protein
MIEGLITSLAAQGATPSPAQRTEPNAAPSEPRRSRRAEGFELTPEQQRIVAKMAARDREVRQHETAHRMVGGACAGAPSYKSDYGPGERPYAVSGEAPIDVFPISDDPEATIANMRIVAAAALAPPEPSVTDRAVAALAWARMIEAQRQLAVTEEIDREAFSVRI